MLFTVICTLSFCSPTHAADFSLKPVIAIGEEYTDNVYEARDYMRSDFITRLLPGLALKYQAPFWDWDIAYNLDYRYYARNSRDNDTTHNLAANGQIRLIDELFFLDVSDTYKRVSLDVSRDYTQEGLFANQSDSNTITASPYFVFHPGTRTTIKTGYRYVNVWYREPDAVDKREHSGFINIKYEISPKMSFSADYLYTHQNSVNPYDRHTPSAGLRYEYADKCFVFGYGGFTWIDYRDGADLNKPYWDAGITHTFDRFSVTATAGVKYPEDPRSGFTRETSYSLAVNKPLERGSIDLSVSYSDYDGEYEDRDSKYGVNFMGKYSLTEKLGSSLTASVERYDYRLPSGHTRRIYITPGLSYSLPWDTSLSLNYSYVHYHSASRYEDNYAVNRVFLEMKKVF